MKKPHLVLLDANHLMHRAFWAIPRGMRTKAGEPVNAVYGVCSMLIKILEVERPTACIACFDAGKETFRHSDHPQYKAGRQETPQEFYDQIPRVQEGLTAFGIPCIAKERYEADDLLATFARQGERQGYRVTVVTGDRDALQLASTQVQIAIPHKGYEATEYLGPAAVRAKYGVDPVHIPDYKGLVGDTSDNLAGVSGIGPKRGKEILQRYGTLEEVYGHLADLPDTLRQKLEAGRESAFATRKLAVLVSDLDLPLPLQEATLRIAFPRVQAFFDAVEFMSLRRRFENLLQSSPVLRDRVEGVVEVGSPATRQVQIPGRTGDDQLPLFAER